MFTGTDMRFRRITSRDMTDITTKCITIMAMATIITPPRRAATLLWWRGLRVLMTSKAMPDRVSHTGQARSEGPDEEQHKEGLSV
ncbi:unnamed protein product, partial [Iphiclides podalirius]